MKKEINVQLTCKYHVSFHGRTSEIQVKEKNNEEGKKGEIEQRW
jgi:hypothetical protein